MAGWWVVVLVGTCDRRGLNVTPRGPDLIGPTQLWGVLDGSRGGKTEL